jgi:KipI family sensor histidine kinase inhibitor
VRRALPAGDAGVLLELDGPAGDAGVLLELDGPDADGLDASSPDASGPDASSPDASSPDASSPDASSPAARLAAAIGAAGLAGVLDVIPGARTVLVIVEPGSWDTGELARRLLAVRAPAGSAGTRAPTVEIEVCYDGPDLAEVAALTGLAVGEVIDRHQAAEYEVGWLGFSPGFGYLTGLDPALQPVPRLDSPRLAVPAGSVAIAGGLAAVYPARSPGGWRLLGRTSARMWDPDRQPPALLMPGMRVRFRAVARLAGGEPDPRAAAGDDPAGDAGGATGDGPGGATGDGPGGATGDGPGGRAVDVLQPGPLTTVQDAGRPGLGHLGVPRSGAADVGSFQLANALAGNDAAAACLEATLGRLAVRFGCQAHAAVTGAPVPLRLSLPDGRLREPGHGTAFAVPAGSVLRLGSPRSGLRSYLAVSGGFDVPPVLGSRSADVLSGLGPPPLRAGDRIRLGTPPAAPLGGPGALGSAVPAQGDEHPEPAVPLPGAGAPGSAAVPAPGDDPPQRPEMAPAADIEVWLGAIVGPRHDWFTPAALDLLATGSYEVTTASNRTGLRLAGPRLPRARSAELPSEGVATGSLQVSHDGQPILLLADHPTTGGYPVIAVVRAADVDRAAQLRPGQRVRFRLDR